MLAKKTMSLLSGFTRREKKAFSRWMESPSHNTDKGLYLLAQYLLNVAPATAPTAFSVEKLWEIIYSKKPAKEGVLRVKIRQLTQQIEDFLVWQELLNDQSIRQQLLLRAKRDKLPFPRYEYEAQKVLKAKKKHAISSLEYYAERIAIRRELKDHPGFDRDRTSGAHLYQLDEDIDAYLTLFKYRLRVELYNRRQVLGEDYEQRFLEAIAQERASGLLPDSPTVLLYGLLLQLLARVGDFALLSELRTAFEANVQGLSIRDQHNVFYTIINQLSRLINQGRQEYLNEIVDWYNLGLEAGVITPDGVISPVAFSNIALLSYRAGQFDWAEAFIEDYGTLLPAAQKEITIAANLGVGDFYRKDYLGAVTKLSGLETGKVLGLRVRLTIVRSLYELMMKDAIDYEVFYRGLNNFESWLQRNTRFSKSALLPYRNHLRFLRKIAKLRLAATYKGEAQRLLLERLRTTKDMVARGWLVEKLIGKGS